jgi:hypothetical protein
MAIHSTVLVDTGQQAANVLESSGVSGVAVTTMYFCNTNTAATAFTLHVVGAGFIANANNIVYKNKVITAGDTYVVDWEKLVLGPGDTIRGNANVGNSIVATVSTIGV